MHHRGIHYKAEVESSFFTSDIKFEIHFDEDRFGKAMTDVYAEYLALPVTVEYKVEHGPIFYKNGLGIGFAKLNAEIKVSEMLAGKLKENFLETVPQDVTLSLAEVLCFDKMLKIEMHSSAIALEKDGEKVTIEPLVGNGLIDTETLFGSFDLTLPKMSVEGNGVIAMIKGTTMHVEMKDILAGKYLLGEGQLKVAKVNIQRDGLSKPVEMDFVAEVKTEREAGDYLMADIAMQFNQEGLEQLDPTANGIAEQVDFSMKLQGISMDALRNSKRSTSNSWR